MNREDILNALETLKGKEYSSYSTAWAVRSVLDKLFKDAYINTTPDVNGYITYKEDRQTLNIYYYINGGSYPVGAVRIGKKKGKHHYNYFSGSYDWTISRFDADVYSTDGTVETRIKDIEKSAAELKKSKDTRHTEVVNFFKKTMETFGLTFDEVMKFAKDIEKFDWDSDFKKEVIGG